MDSQNIPNLPLETIQKKLIGLRDDVRSVALGYIAGLLVWGAAGIGKSWNIEDELRRMNVTPRKLSGTMTPRAMFLQLQRYPEDIHLIEDQESLLSSRDALSILCAAWWTTDGNPTASGRIPDREVHWETARGSEAATFGGGIIIVQNSPLPQTPQMQAVQSRVLTRHMTVSTDGLIAMMRHLAATRPPTIMNYSMNTAECSEVAEYVISQSLSGNQPLNMRLLYIAYSFYVQFQLGDSAQHWHDRVIEQIAGIYPKSHQHSVDMSGRTGLDRQESDREIVRQILRETSDPPEQVRLWIVRAEKGQSTFYKRKKEVDALL